jgi:hypothetical protein
VKEKEKEKIIKLSEELGVSVMEVAMAKLEGSTDYIEPGLVFPLRKIRRAIKSSEKAAAVFMLTKGLIEQNREPGKISDRNILQEIGGGPLEQGEWVAFSKSPDKKSVTIWGTRGLHSIRIKQSQNHSLRSS